MRKVTLIKNALSSLRKGDYHFPNPLISSCLAMGLCTCEGSVGSTKTASLWYGSDAASKIKPCHLRSMLPSFARHFLTGGLQVTLSVLQLLLLESKCVQEAHRLKGPSSRLKHKTPGKKKKQNKIIHKSISYRFFSLLESNSGCMLRQHSYPASSSCCP